MNRYLTGFLIFLFWSNYSSAKQKPVIRISEDTINARQVSPLTYGNFIELGFARQIEGLWGQKFYNASFEEVTPYRPSVYGWLQRQPGDDLSDEIWWHSGYEENPWYLWPENKDLKPGYNQYWNFHHGYQSIVLHNSLSAGKARLAQDGIFIKPGSSYRFEGYFSNNQTADTKAAAVSVTIGIYPEKDFDNPLFTADLVVPDGIWKEYTVDIPVLNYPGRATFAVSVDTGNTVACDGFSLMAADEYKGWRSQVVEELDRIGVPMIRFPGGCFASFYDWRVGVGPRLERRPVESRYWGGIEENQVGTVEFIELCEMIGSEPFLCVNMLTGTADHAARWVEYCNSPAGNSGMGALRATHGYPEPFDVKYWELDNETYRRFGPLQYARKCVEFSKAMKAVDPDIKLVMVGYWRFNDHLQEMLEIAGPYIDVITNRERDEERLGNDLEILKRYNEKRGTSITLSNTEWLAPLTWEATMLDALNFESPPGDMTLQEHQVSWRYAMNTARQLLIFQRLGGDFEFANFNNLANTWGQNIIECPKDTVFISAAGRVFELMSRSPVAWVMETTMEPGVPGLVTQAGISSDGKQLAVYLLNYNGDQGVVRLASDDRKFDASGIIIQSIFADEPLDYNSRSNPDKIKREFYRPEKASAKGVEVKIIPWSVSEIIIPLK